jgi:hypothetical protein
LGRLPQIPACSTIALGSSLPAHRDRRFHSIGIAGSRASGSLVPEHRDQPFRGTVIALSRASDHPELTLDIVPRLNGGEMATERLSMREKY